MKIINCDQGTPEWHGCRAGIPTASAFDKIITSTGKASTQAEAYINQLLAEQMAGQSGGIEPTEWMLRGIEMEAEARLFYELETGRNVDQAGFIVGDGCGCSPDGMIGDDGLIEIKCPKPETHVGYLRANKLPTKYVCQVQGQLWVCERDWCDFLSYCPGLPPVLVRVERDEEFIDKLAAAMVKFNAKLAKARAELVERGYIQEQAA